MDREALLRWYEDVVLSRLSEGTVVACSYRTAADPPGMIDRLLSSRHAEQDVATPYDDWLAIATFGQAEPVAFVNERTGETRPNPNAPLPPAPPWFDAPEAVWQQLGWRDPLRLEAWD